MKRKQWFAVAVAALGLMTARADLSDWTEYFVSDTAGNDAWDGTTNAWAGAGTLKGPKKTIQAAVELADGKGTVVTVAPGVYDEGGAPDANTTYPFSNRVYIAKANVLLRSSGGKEVTHIVGAHDSAGWYELGTNAVRCVEGCDLSKVTVKGFTLRDGAAGYDFSTAKATAIRGGGAVGVTVVDCVVSNCTAHRGAAGYSSRFIRSVLTGNYCANGGLMGDAGENCYYLNSLITRNRGVALVGSPYQVINCTFAGNPDQKVMTSANIDARFSNCVFVNNKASDLTKTKETCALVVENCVANGNAKMPTADETTVTNAANYQYRSSAGFSWRLMADAEAVGKGKGSCLSLFTLPACEGGVYRDLNGNEIDPESDAIDAGCFQGDHFPVAASGSMVVFGSDGVRADGLGDFETGDWIVSRAFPEMFRFKSATATKAYSFYNSDTDVSYEDKTVGYYQHYPEEDGWARYVANPDRTAINSVKMISVAAELYVNPLTGDDANDGSEAHPLRTLQAANDAATASYTLVHAAPGLYAEGGARRVKTSGGAEQAAFSNRLCVTRQHISFVSDTPRGAVIVGAPDPATGSLGTNAMRCVAFTSAQPSYSCLRGFDLTGGHTLEGPLDDNFFYGAAINAPDRRDVQIVDCVISNNCGYQTVVFGTTLRRSTVRDNALEMNATLRGARAYDCVLAGNEASSYQTGYICELAGCTLNTAGEGLAIGHGGSTVAYMNGCVAENCGEVSFGGLSAEPVASYLTGGYDPLHFARPAACDYRLSALSPALGLVKTADFAAITRWWQFFGLDAYGAEPVFGADGSFAAGASRAAALQYAVATGNSDTVVTGGTLGTNVLADATATFTFDATAVKRPYDGFATNGVLVATGKTWSIGAADLANGEEFGLHLTGTWYVDAAAEDDSGDGFTPATAKHTLVGASTNAISGEVVLVAPGTYSDGSALGVSTHTTASRVVVPAGVTVKSTGGRDVTVIRGANATVSPDSQGNGADAVRCAYVGKGGVLSGFTLTGGRTQYDAAKNSGVNYSGGGALGAGSAVSRVVDCVVYGCSAHSGVAGTSVRFMDSVISNNTYSSGNGAGGGRSQISRSCSFRNCLFDYTTAANALEQFARVESCTFGPNLKMPVLYNPSTSVDPPHAVNCVFLGKGNFYNAGSTQGVFTNCVFGPLVTYPALATTNGCIRATAEEFVFADRYRPVVGANVCVDAALAEFCTDTDVDATGAQRVMNGARDIGGAEADWRPDYAADLGRKLEVTEVSPAVVETAERAVRLPASDAATSLAVRLLRADASERMHRLVVRVAEGATLHLWEGETERATFTAAAGEQEYEFKPSAGGATLRFTCTGTEGAADLLALKAESDGAVFIIR